MATPRPTVHDQESGWQVAAVGVTPQTKSMKVPKLAKKDKARLPRRQKKALQKADQL